MDLVELDLTHHLYNCTPLIVFKRRKRSLAKREKERERERERRRKRISVKICS